MNVHSEALNQQLDAVKDGLEHFELEKGYLNVEQIMRELESLEGPQKHISDKTLELLLETKALQEEIAKRL